MQCTKTGKWTAQSKASGSFLSQYSFQERERERKKIFLLHFNMNESTNTKMDKLEQCIQKKKTNETHMKTKTQKKKREYSIVSPPGRLPTPSEHSR